MELAIIGVSRESELHRQLIGGRGKRRAGMKKKEGGVKSSMDVRRVEEKRIRESRSAKMTRKVGKAKALERLKRDKLLYIMLIPGFLYFLIFKYGPMLGLITAFQDYNPISGWFGSEFVGFKHFKRFFADPKFFQLFRNTLILAFCNIIFYFPLPIILALLINEVKNGKYKNVIQSVLYLPHFVSWVVVAGICMTMFSAESGALTGAVSRLFGREVRVLSEPAFFPALITGQIIWKECGWGTIIFLAALTGVDTQLYEAARVDGANRCRQTWHITLPAIKPTIITMLILRMGSFLNTGFEQIFLMLNSMNREVGEVFDTYVYQTAMTNGRISYGSAVGMFKSVICLLLVMTSNKIAEKAGEEGIY